MSTALHYALLTLRLNFRNPMAIVYGFLFPLVFLIAFAIIYRHDAVPVISHLGELLTVTALGGACFGLPTALVAERERGVWRRYRGTGTPTAVFIAGLVISRLVLLVMAATLQLAIAVALLGMPIPAHPAALALAFLVLSCALIGLGMIVAMAATSVPAVQALGQCIFLPMLMIGGVAVRIESLPGWTQALSAYFPGRYTVAMIQRTATGVGPGLDWRELLPLAGFTLASALVAASLFRWDAARRRAEPRLLALGVVLWLAAGTLGLRLEATPPPVATDGAKVPPPSAFLRLAPPQQPPPPAPAEPVAPAALPSWRDVTQADIDTIAFERLPDDEGLVSPIAQRGSLQDSAVAEQIAGVRAALPGWSPARDDDPLQRTRNLLYIAAVPDLLQMDPLERNLPWLVFDRLRQDIAPEDLPRILFWISQHPEEGEDAAARQLGALGLPELTGPTDEVRERVMLYALKFLCRLEQVRTPD